MVKGLRLSLFLLSLGLLLCGCHKELEYRSGGGARLYLSYTEPDSIPFARHVQMMRWLLFDADGRLVSQLEMEPRKRLYMPVDDLPDGDYTIVNVANAADKTLFDNITSLADFRIWADTYRDDDGGYYENTDHLFWGIQKFRLKAGETSVPLPLVDAHCHLHVHATWQGVPENLSGRYTFRMYNVPVCYLGGREGFTIQGLDYPALEGTIGEHRIDAELYNLELTGEFVTFRWTDDHVPALQVWCDDEPITPLIDLYIAFDRWDWSPDVNPRQDYWLQIEIRTDGSVYLNKWGLGGRILDWVNGGTIRN